MNPVTFTSANWPTRLVSTDGQILDSWTLWTSRLPGRIVEISRDRTTCNNSIGRLFYKIVRSNQFELEIRLLILFVKIYFRVLFFLSKYHDIQFLFREIYRNDGFYRNSSRFLKVVFSSKILKDYNLFIRRFTYFVKLLSYTVQ